MILLNYKEGEKDMKYDSFNKAVGDYLLEYRQKHNLTQQQMADMIGKSKDWYREIERGRNSLLFHDAGPLCEALGIDISELGRYAREHSKRT